MWSDKMKKQIIQSFGFACLGMALLSSGSSIFLLFTDSDLAAQLNAQGIVDDQGVAEIRKLEASLDQSRLDFALEYGPFSKVQDPETKLAMTQYKLERDLEYDKTLQSAFGFFMGHVFTILGFLILGLSSKLKPASQIE